MYFELVLIAQKQLLLELLEELAIVYNLSMHSLTSSFGVSSTLNLTIESVHVDTACI